MRSELSPIENLSFYNPHFKKNSGVVKYNYLFLNFVKEQGFDFSPLQFEEETTKKSGSAKVYLLRRGEDVCKIRICCSEREALIIDRNVQYACSLGLPVSRSLGVFGPLVLLEYLPGEAFDKGVGNVRSIARIHAAMNKEIKAGGVENKLRNLFISSLEVLSGLPNLKNCLSDFNKNFPAELTPVFDHQDFGINNLIQLQKGGLAVIDEEAFSILPFGYSLHRAIKGRRKYSVCSSNNEGEEYLRSFPKDRVGYYQATKNFWETMFRIREGAKVSLTGDKTLARRLVEHGAR